MISDQAKEGIDHIVKLGIKASLLPSPDTPCEIEELTDTSLIPHKKVVILTISSYMFRLMIGLHFTKSVPIMHHFSAISNEPVENMNDQVFLDVIGECGNLLCGTMNRELSRFFPHIGMSTPNVLDKNCIDYLTATNPGYLKHFKLAFNDEVTLHASLCVCDYADMDFTVDMTEEEESTGELEFF